MTMHVVLGDGEMTRKELSEALAEIWKTDEEAGATIWFLIQGKAEPSDTDKTLVTWLEKNEIYYEIVTDDAASVDAVYSQPQEVHTAKRLAQKVVNLMESKPEEGESAEVLALFVSEDVGAEEDRWLNDVCQAVFDAGYVVRALNDGLAVIDMSEEAAAAEAEPEPEPAPLRAIKAGAATKKAPAKAVDTPVSEAVATKPTGALTRSGLEELDLPALKEIAAQKGLTLPPRSRMGTYIDAILGEAEVPPEAEVEVAETPATATLNGTNQQELVEEVAAKVIVTLLTAIKEAINEIRL